MCKKKKWDKIKAMLVLSKCKSASAKSHRLERRVYFCNECMSYHLTSK